MQQLKFIIIPGAVAILIYLGFDFFEQVRDTEESTGQAPSLDYNGYSEGINTVYFDELGNIRYTMDAKRQISYLNRETTLEEPFIQLYEENDSHWNIVSRSGRISASTGSGHDVQEIVLDGDVEVYQLNESGDGIVLTTDTLTIEPTDDLISTEADVVMTGENFEQTATGMHIDLGTEEYIFHRNVRGRYAVPQN